MRLPYEVIFSFSVRWSSLLFILNWTSYTCMYSDAMCISVFVHCSGHWSVLWHERRTHTHTQCTLYVCEFSVQHLRIQKVTFWHLICVRSYIVPLENQSSLFRIGTLSVRTFGIREYNLDFCFPHRQGDWRCISKFDSASQRMRVLLSANFLPTSASMQADSKGTAGNSVPSKQYDLEFVKGTRIKKKTHFSDDSTFSIREMSLSRFVKVKLREIWCFAEKMSRYNFVSLYFVWSEHYLKPFWKDNIDYPDNPTLVHIYLTKMSLVSTRGVPSLPEIRPFGSHQV